MVVTTLGPHATSSVNTNRLDFNSKLPAIWNAYNAAHVGRELFMFDTASVLSNPALLFDGLHPNDAGYALLATAIESALSAPPPASF